MSEKEPVADKPIAGVTEKRGSCWCCISKSRWWEKADYGSGTLLGEMIWMLLLLHSQALKKPGNCLNVSYKEMVKTDSRRLRVYAHQHLHQREYWKGMRLRVLHKANVNASSILWHMHEIVDVVTEVGNKVLKVKVGDNVGVGCLVGSCRSCDHCVVDQEQSWPKMVLTYNATIEVTYGGYSDHMVANQHFIVA
ncbi:8-hydroxygeraniol dehydrogenase [Artemisia annua]|uniref:8-hydroxygeraniol dehydrogenase n=1 Tax=Artemisia annua TaxID=35608 RepID=A0A2U1QLM5_ARTAN|nr:8-hydroxygeraniol dehydrogenase [Artemisia annua]